MRSIPPQDESESGPLVRLEHVGKAYPMGEVTVEVLRDVTLEVQSRRTDS